MPTYKFIMACIIIDLAKFLAQNLIFSSKLEQFPAYTSLFYPIISLIFKACTFISTSFYANVQTFPTYTFIRYSKIFLPAQLFRPAHLLI